MRRSTMTVLAVTAALVVTACGSDDDGGGDAATTAATASAATTGAPTTAAAPTTTEAATATTSAASSSDDPEAEAASQAWTTAFDSALGFDEKAEHIEDAEALRTTIEAYGPAGEAVGGIELVPTAVVVSGDTATITYDVMFAGQPAYQGQEGTIERVDGTWMISREEFCGFMGAARNACPA